MEKVYLDLETILLNFHQSGDLYADLPAKKLSNKVPWKAHLRVVEGNVVACQILDNVGAEVNSGDRALKALYQLGRLFWEFSFDPQPGASIPADSQADKSSGTLPGSPEQLPITPELPVTRHLVPRRLIAITVKQMNQAQWPRDYRMIYLLIDGQRTVEKIANMIGLPLQEVELVLHDLHSSRLIDLAP